MRLVWNGRSYRPVTNFIKVKDDDINELMKPLSQKTKLGSAVLTGYVINAKPNPEGGDVPVVSPSPTPTLTMTPTNTSTSTNTPTPSITPSSTPYILPETPALWYDATNVGSIDYITSGGTNYLANWRSIGVYQKTLSAATINNSPVWSGSSQLPGSPNVVRFVGSTASGTTKYLSQRFDPTLIPQTGGTVFIVVASPTGATYASSASFTFGYTSRLFSGNTTTGGFDTGNLVNSSPQILTQGNQAAFGITKQGVTVQNQFAYTGTNLNNKFLIAATYPFPTGNFEMEINQSGFTSPNLFTGNTFANSFNQFSMGQIYQSGGTFFANTTNNCEVGEYMFFNRVLTQDEVEQVQNYLRDKWRYDEWASPVPTPTPTDTPSVTPTPSVSPTTTMTPTNTSTPTPSPSPVQFSPSGLTNLQMWFLSTSGASVSSWTNYGLLGGSVSQGTGSQQPTIQTSTLGSFSGQAVTFSSRDNMAGLGFTSTNYSSSTVFSVMKVNSTDAAGWSIDLYTTGPNNNSWSWQSRNTGQTSIARKNPGSSTSPNRTIAPLLLATSGTTGSFFTASYNDVLGTSGTTTNTGTTANTLQFGYDPSSSSSTNIEIFEYLVYNRVLTTTEYNDVMNYLKTKYQYNTW